MATVTFTYAFGTQSISDNFTTILGKSVSGMAGLVTGLSVTLNGLNHTFADDLDILLIAPDGMSNLMLLSDAGDSDDFVNATLTFSDTAAGVFSDNAVGSPIGSGDYSPTAYGTIEFGSDLSAGPIALNHPATSGGATLASEFNGVDPNGNWWLHIRDDAFGDSGALDSWSLTITTNSSFHNLFGTVDADYISVTSTSATSGSFSINGVAASLYSGISGFVINGYGGNDVAFGSTGDDILNGGEGRDSLFGAGGNDTFGLGSVADLVAGEIYNGGGGVDTLAFNGDGANVVYDLRLQTVASIEIVMLTHSGANQQDLVHVNAAQFGSGISFSSTIIGDSSAVLSDMFMVTMGTVSSIDLSGLTIVNFNQSLDQVGVDGDESAETMIGTGGHDALIGNGGADILNGFTGADYMRGGTGDDRYYVDNAGDVTDETLLGGGTFDLVLSWVSFTAALGIERLQLSGSANINAIGANGQFDSLYGNTGNNILNGLTGADTMRGGLGNDTYYVDNAGDWTDETGGGGVDSVLSWVSYTALAGIDKVFLQGSAAINGVGRNGQNDAITGNAGANTINGLSGNDTLDGGLGVDTLVGGIGLDIFKFTTAAAAGNLDYVTDYALADDSIQIDNAVFALLGGPGALVAGLFKNLALGAQDANDVLVYNQATGALYYDANGLTAGGQTQIADFSNGLALTASEFAVI